MEFKDYVKLIKKKIWLLIGIVIISILGVYYFTVSAPVTYDGSAFINIAVQKQVKSDATYYDYDNYYALQASSLFADSVVTWLKDPSNVVAIYNSAELTTPDINLKDYSKVIKATKLQPSSVQIITNNKDSDSAKKLAESSIDFVKSKLDTWKTENLANDLFFDSTQPVVSEHKVNLMLNLLIGLVFGVVLGLFVIYLQESLKEK